MCGGEEEWKQTRGNRPRDSGFMFTAVEHTLETSARQRNDASMCSQLHSIIEFNLDISEL